MFDRARAARPAYGDGRLRILYVTGGRYIVCFDRCGWLGGAERQSWVAFRGELLAAPDCVGVVRFAGELDLAAEYLEFEEPC